MGPANPKIEAAAKAAYEYWVGVKGGWDKAGAKQKDGWRNMMQVAFQAVEETHAD